MIRLLGSSSLHVNSTLGYYNIEQERHNNKSYQENRIQEAGELKLVKNTKSLKVDCELHPR